MITPRGGDETKPTAAPDYVAYQMKRARLFENANCTMTQEVILLSQQIINNAMQSGQGHARIQTLMIGGALATYTFINPPKEDTHVIYDNYTLQPFKNVHIRVRLNSRVKPLTDWIYSQGLRFIFTSERMTPFLMLGEPVFSKFLHVVAVFVPQDGDLREKQPGQSLVLWNSVHMQKCLDTSMVPEWSNRLLMAIRAGAGHFFVSTLYYMSDYEEEDKESQTPMEFCVRKPRHHLSMMPVDPDPRWVLNRKFTAMVSWISGLGYGWTLCVDTNDEGILSQWAYFTVFLAPLPSFY